MGLRWMMLKAKWWLFTDDVFKKKMRRKYCNLGFHHIRQGGITHSKTGKDWKMHTKNVRFLTCQFCNYYFFASPKDKTKYLEMTTKERSAFREMLSYTKPKQLHGGGRNSKKGVSVSSSP